MLRNRTLHGYNEGMEPQNVDPPVWVDTLKALTKMVESLSEKPRIAVDTESNSLFAYQEKVCLIQISTPENDYLIDPFSFSDLSLLAPVFANPGVEKIFHAAEYDLICLKRDYHFEFNAIFDTMIASRILGLPEIGLGSLLLSRFDIALDKRYQRANWGSRPINPAMLAYAALDSHYLFQLRDSLAEDLKAQNLYDLAEEDFHLVSKVEGHKANGNNTNAWKVAGNHKITPQQAAILDKLCQYRDEQARKADVPHFKVLSNQVLLDICTSELMTLDDLSNVPGMGSRLFQRHGMGLWNAIQTGLTAEPIHKTRRVPNNDEYVRRMEQLKTWRKKTAGDLKVESDVVLPKEVMESIAFHNPQTTEELSSLMNEVPVRFTKYGQKILDCLKTEEAQ